MTRSIIATRAGTRARRRRASAQLALVLSLALLSGCSQSEAKQSASEVRESEAGEPSASPSESPKASPKARAPKSLKGGGFASAVPGSDDPERKDDTGPVIPLSADGPSIKEIERLVREVEKIAKQQAEMEPSTTGGSLDQALGTFSYRYYADGSLDPDPAWVEANITTETMPILGSVNGHRVMLPQLRGALQEVADRGLASEIHPEEYAGCYVPRFIGSDPSSGLSLHAWGIAVDLNVPGNLRGTSGEIDRTVVAIFKKWGFAWGGDWDYTDPMHFELARLVEAR